MNKTYFNNICQVINKEINELKDSYMYIRLKKDHRSKMLLGMDKIETRSLNGSVITINNKDRIKEINKIIIKSRL